jgi:ATP synthase protein I
VHDPIAAGRSAAARAVAVEVAATGLVAVGFLALDTRHALAAALGGAAMAGGNIAAATIALAGGIQPAPAAFARLLLGVLAKWMVVLAVFVLVLAAWRLPPLPALAGLAASTLAYLLALNWTGPRAGRANQGKVKRER